MQKMKYMNGSYLTKENQWQTALQTAITDPAELFQLLDLDTNLLEGAYAAAKLFPLKVPRSLLARIQKQNINDPILKQLLPLGIEKIEVENYSKDPLQEKSANPVPGLLHKYHGRVLLTLTSVCGINCRYCFRRHFPYMENNPGTQGWQEALDYIAQDKSIVEVILSGGDPLIVSDHLLSEFSQKLTRIPHLTRLRIHSRMPIILPERITPEFIQWCSDLPLKVILVTHCNHPQELNESVAKAMQNLTKVGVTVLNQAVLLKGINDSAETLIDLSEELFRANILPYYLHILDKVEGAAHFDLDRKKAMELHWQITKQLPGFLVPKLACEEPGAPAKRNLVLFDLFTG
jgi:EF-P beta-lysylation protein EpmB